MCRVSPPEIVAVMNDDDADLVTCGCVCVCVWSHCGHWGQTVMIPEPDDGM